jgi:hypothetical protein
MKKLTGHPAKGGVNTTDVSRWPLAYIYYEDTDLTLPFSITLQAHI